MRETKQLIWELVKVNANTLVAEDKNIKLTGTYEIFSKQFDELYAFIKETYMKTDTETLDRHKVASIIIISIIKSDVVKYENLCEEDIFLGNQMIALNIGLSFMLNQLNNILNKYNKKIDDYFFPEPFSCDTDYFDVMVRNLYFATYDYVLNPLELSEKLFLFEYITLQKNNIDLKLLKI